MCRDSKLVSINEFLIYLQSAAKLLPIELNLYFIKANQNLLDVDFVQFLIAQDQILELELTSLHGENKVYYMAN